MKSAFAAVILFLLAATLAQAQTIGRRQFANPARNSNEGGAVSRAIASLKELEADTIVYRSLGDFEENEKLARLPLESFKSKLDKANAEVNSLLVVMFDSPLKSDIRNALASYNDGAYWWQKVYQPRVINVSSLAPERTSTATDAFLQASIPYTVAIQWRQASRYLQRAERRAASLSQ